MTDPTIEFERHRRRLSQLSYRMLGSHADTEDVLQEAYLRWSRTDHDAVQSPAAFLTTIVTRLCIDRRRDIDARKETYVGPWLPDPILEPVPPPERSLETAEAVSLAFLYVMERLSAGERAAYLLRRVFGYDYNEIAGILEKSSASCRQLVSRAERKILEGRPRFDPAPDDVWRMSRAFLEACTNGDLDGLVALLSDDVVMVSDGGGKVPAALRPIVGADRVARFFLGIFRKASSYARAEPVIVNGAPGLAGYVDQQLVTVISLDIADGHIHGCYIVRNPDKLARAVGMREGKMTIAKL